MDVQNVGKQLSNGDQATHLKLAGEIMELETNVQYCTVAGIEWLEVTEDLLKHFNKGAMPSNGYIIYKNVKLCVKDTAEDIAKRERMTCNEVLFKDENHMKVR